MSTKATAEETKVQPLRLSSLVIDPLLSGRTEKEIKHNAEALAPAMKAAGGWQPTQPGQFFMRGGKPHLLAGFTRHAAALLSGFKDGFFIEVPDDAQSIRLTAIRTNLSRGISQVEQGRIFAGMRDGSDPATLKKGETALAPMKPDEIADEIGVSRTHVSKCIAIFESSPEIRVLLEEEKVSANIVYEAKKLANGDPSQQLKILSAAIKEAAGQIATKKHFDAIKGEFAPKLRAVSTNGNAPKKKKPEGELEEETPSEEPGADQTGNRVAEETRAQVESVLQLGTTEPGPKKQSSQDKKSERANLIAVLLKCDEEQVNNSLSDSDAEAYADAILAAGFHQSSPI